MKRTNNILNNTSLFLLPFSLFIGLGITKIINNARTDAWICIILGTVIGLFINYLLTKMPDNNVKVMKYVSSFALLLLVITTLTKLISSVYLDRTSNILVMIPFIILVLYSGLKNRYALMKVISILTIIYVGIMIFAAGSLIPTINLDEFKPILINSPSNILLGSIEYALYSIAPMLVMPDFKNSYNYKVYLLSSLVILGIFVLIIGNLGIELASSYRYPEYMIFKNIAILDFIENIENILFFIWIINIYTLSAHTIINIRECVDVKGMVITLIIIAFIVNTFLVNNYKSPIMILKFLDYIIGGIAGIDVLGRIYTR